MRTFYGKTPTAPSYGFVKFKTDAMARHPAPGTRHTRPAARAPCKALAAITGMNGREFNGHVMSVRLANNDTTGPYPRTAAVKSAAKQSPCARSECRTPPPQPMQTSGGTNLYVSGLPPDAGLKVMAGLKAASRLGGSWRADRHQGQHLWKHSDFAFPC